jgi:hypothetical protein
MLVLLRSAADILSVMLVYDSEVTVYPQEHKYISHGEFTYSLPRVTSVGSGPYLLVNNHLFVLSHWKDT